LLIAQRKKNLIEVLDVNTGDEIRRIKTKFGIALIVFTTDSNNIIASDVGRGNLKAFSVDTGREIWGNV